MTSTTESTNSRPPRGHRWFSAAVASGGRLLLVVVFIAAALLKWFDPAPEHLLRQSRSCCPADRLGQYRLAMFARWQATEESFGLITPGQVEAGIRWNGINYNYRYFEFGVIRRHLRGRAVKTGRKKAVRKVAVAG